MAKPIQHKVSYKKNKPVETKPVLAVSVGQAKPKAMSPNGQFLQHYELIIGSLSPVHIGCGDDFEPTNYVIEGNSLHYFSESVLASVLSDSDRHRLLQLIDGKNNPLADVQKFIFDKRQAIIATGKTKQVAVSDSVASKYKNSIGKVVHAGNKAVNALEIERTSYHPHTGLPFLAGSSLKGSIRTALLNAELAQRADLRNSPVDAKKPKAIEENLLNGKFQTDPLRLVKVGDAPYQVKEGRMISQVRWQVNKAKKINPDGRETQANLSTLVECVPERQDMNFRTQLTLHAVHEGQEVRDKQGNYMTPDLHYSITTIVKHCNDYYLKEWHKERNLIESLGYVNSDWLKWMDDMLSTEGSFGKLMAQNAGMLLRVGKHSGAEAITLDDIAKIKIMGKKGTPPQYLAETKTLWLASETQDKANTAGQLLPFGWIFVQVKSSH